ncbi:LysR family transcriptional regulator [Streptomyces sp. Amel2xC10]|uniref:LysR family transcriptional regulator n=1 Tax=Streptomyces sp. Amel2xC10 TaxID=1305826 RepID=UPI000A08955A|nr:LysR family transcriptional regulator [Streptomyces sp. Amel2xC10]SMF79010.1 ModE molybdate transport repressor domain-containing protein [Streptomyces sp. Amel2xC10]
MTCEKGEFGNAGRCTWASRARKSDCALASSVDGMKLEIRHLEVLCSIAETGSIRKAARDLGMSQPALTTQLRRIEEALGARLFAREQNGCRLTPAGQAVLSRARPLVAQMSTLIKDIRTAAVRTSGSGLRIGATADRALPGWLRRLQRRFPDVPVSLHINVSAHTLLQDLARGRIDLAFVHEVEGCPLRVPNGLEGWTLLDREPQFISMSVDHPAAVGAVVDIRAFADDPWMVDPAVDGELAGLQRVLHAAGISPPLVQGDYRAVSTLVMIGAAVAPCRPVSSPCEDLVVRPLRDDPIAVKLLVYCRAGTEMECICADLRSAYAEAALRTPAYRDWLAAHGNPLGEPSTDRSHSV